jgi:hypothetical protein
MVMSSCAMRAHATAGSFFVKLRSFASWYAGVEG